MAATGAGAWAANPDWSISFFDYDVEVYSFHSEDTFCCGLLLGPEWRLNSRGEVRPGRDREFNIVPHSDRRPYLPQSVSYLPRLRPSTALIMNLMAELQHGEVLLDPFGGVGTIAIDAACRFERLTCITADKDISAYHTAASHCATARKTGRLAQGSSVKSRNWDARRLKLPDASVDAIVSDLPFLNKCCFRDGPTREGTSARAGLGQVLIEMGRVLRTERSGGLGPGRAIILVQSHRLVMDSLERGGWKSLGLDPNVKPNPVPVVIGGFAAWIFVLQRLLEPPLRDSKENLEELETACRYYIALRSN
eukprot:TRINITY_DN63550_c0_g1_i1.p1 TRINITY_DN63550_c0_g1~~TRINITY_DN63550_c0_g1_i1.p1  ORF type:complete len:334 (+),score=44.44 TRINITY_DN63550_c0_g1_i1:80-1003(+)